MTLPKIPIWLRTRKGIAFANIPVHRGGRMADFCIIGSAKCGTTALDQYLSNHPQIFCGKPKEPHYFSSPVMLERGQEWYEGLFAQARTNQTCGEASTSYTRWPLVAGTAERMHHANPAMKLIYIVRNPVDRIESEVLQTVKYLRNVVGEDLGHLTLDAALETIEDPASPWQSAVVETSKYENQIREFERFFPPNQILILTQSTLRRDPEGTMQRVHDFLGVGANPNLTPGERRNVTSDYLAGVARIDTTDRLRRFPLYALAKRLLPRSIKDRLLSRMSPAIDPRTQQLSGQMRQRLEIELAPHTAAFERRLGLPATEW